MARHVPSNDGASGMRNALSSGSAHLCEFALWLWDMEMDRLIDQSSGDQSYPELIRIAFRFIMSIMALDHSDTCAHLLCQSTIIDIPVR